MFNLFPLTHLELGDQFVLDDALSYGTLPKVFAFSSHRDKVLFLKEYAEAYLNRFGMKLPSPQKSVQLAHHVQWDR